MTEQQPQVWNRKQLVLDHGFVRLVDWMGNDESIVRAARVSYDADGRTGVDAAGDAKLIRYLMAHEHTTPFEAVTLTFEVKAPLFVLRQWHRHRTWSYNEVSARYTELDEGFYVPTLERITTQSKENKQGSSEEVNPNAKEIREAIIGEQVRANLTYAQLLALGCPRELARSVLPVSAYSRMFATVNLHNLFRFLRLRLHSHAQYEIRVYAEAILGILQDLVPVSVAAFKETLS